MMMFGARKWLPAVLALSVLMGAPLLIPGGIDALAQTQAQPAHKKPKPAKPAAPTTPSTAETQPAKPEPEPPPTTNANGFPTIDTAASFAYVIDASTGAVLLDKNANQRMVPSSMTKLMTAYLVFERLKRGDIKMEDQLRVSEAAWRTQGSKMFVELGASIKIEDLIRGMVISSGNDACIVLAEGLSGSVEAFAEQMNAKAKALGLTGTSFRNPDGFPEPNHYTTARDLAELALRTMRDFPEYYPIYSEKEFTYHGIKQGNRNPLLYENLGADGLKTGHTQEAGYGLVGSAVRDGRRLVMVINGLTSMKQRSQESARLMDWGFREFNNYTLFKPGEQVDTADVWLGAEKSVNLVAGEALTVTLPRRSRPEMKVTSNFDNPIPAPIVKGQIVGRLTIAAKGVDPVSLPLVAGEDVGKIGAIGRLGSAASYLIFGRGR